jgi:hypothetical protein
MNKNKLYQKSDSAKKIRTIAKITRLHKMGKVERKKCHRSGKVPLHEDAKSNVGGDCHTIAVDIGLVEKPFQHACL